MWSPFELRIVRRLLLRRALAGRAFSIVSNNCWGAHVYQELGAPYQTPFVGLFLSPAAYLELLSRLRHYLQSPLSFVSKSSEAWINQAREKHAHRWPIGTLDGVVEVQFMHYRTEAEAREKWQRRVARFQENDRAVFVKFDDRDGATEAHFEAFDALPWRNKVLFSVRNLASIKSAVRIPSRERCVPDGLALARVSPKYFDTARWIEGGEGKPRGWRGFFNCV